MAVTKPSKRTPTMVHTSIARAARQKQTRMTAQAMTNIISLCISSRPFGASTRYHSPVLEV
jgi:hypothetical protein